MKVISGDSSTVEYPLFQTECGGSIPTSPLHLLIYEIPVSKACRLNALWHSRLPRIEESNILRNTHQVCFGASFENRYFAVAIWTSPVAQNRFKDGKSILELRRLAISGDAPKNTATRMLKVMRAIIRRKFPEIRRLISYQDTEVHTGGIYAADNWQSIAETAFVSWSGTRKRNSDQSRAAKVRWEYAL